MELDKKKWGRRVAGAAAGGAAIGAGAYSAGKRFGKNVGKKAGSAAEKAAAAQSAVRDTTSTAGVGGYVKGSEDNLAQVKKHLWDIPKRFWTKGQGKDWIDTAGDAVKKGAKKTWAATKNAAEQGKAKDMIQRERFLNPNPDMSPTKSFSKKLMRNAAKAQEEQKDRAQKAIMKALNQGRD